tara:strand:- start:290 stop:412 length:123 start_codon:yes stop_codon:yes gene_type:complete
MKRKIKNIWKKVKSWNDYWAFIERERMKAAKYTCSSGPLL